MMLISIWVQRRFDPEADGTIWGRALIIDYKDQRKPTAF
jgi:hypothetical protein